MVPTVRWIWRSSICISSRSLASRLLSGSSSSRICGRMTSARAKRHALLLAARELAREAAAEGGQSHQFQRLADPPGALHRGHALHFEAERHVLGDRHVRKERVALEHDAEPALGGLHRQKIAALQRDRASGRLDEARDHLQRRGLAAARRAQQGDELALLHAERQAIDREVRAEALGQLLKDEEAHARPQAPRRGTARGVSELAQLAQPVFASSARRRARRHMQALHACGWPSKCRKQGTWGRSACARLGSHTPQHCSVLSSVERGQRSTSRFQRLVQSSRWALMASQSGWITSLARSPTGAIRSSGMLTSTLVLTGPLPISLAMPA